MAYRRLKDKQKNNANSVTAQLPSREKRQIDL